jgi:phage terminase small subunit
VEKAAQLEFAALGITELPDGVSSLTRREMRFVAEYLQHGQMRQAAIAAGYSEESAGSIASETLRKPKVAAFYRKCIDQVAGESLNVLRTCFQRYVIFHAKTLEAAQTRQDADAWLVKGFNRELGKNAKEVTEYELARERAMRDEKHFSALARAEATLLLRATGKLPEGPTVTVNMVPDSVRDHLQELARAGVRVALPETSAHNGGRN